MARTDAGTVVRAAFSRWPIILIAALVVGAAAFGYAVLTTEGPSIEAVSAVRVETVPGLPVQPTVDMGVGMAKSLSTQESAAASAGVEIESVRSVTAYADPNDVQLIRIAVSAEDAESAEQVSDAMAEEVRGMLIAILEPDLGYQRRLAATAAERLVIVDQEYQDALQRLEEEEDLSFEQRLQLENTANGLRNAYWANLDRAASAQFNVDRYETVAMVEGSAVAVEVNRSADIIGLTIQGLLIGAIAGVAVAFFLGYSDARKEALAA
jgi:hypothetical protein